MTRLLLAQPGGFEGLATQPECAKGALRGQVVLASEDAPWRSRMHM
jgi:hypothetical protein